MRQDEWVLMLRVLPEADPMRRAWSPGLNTLTPVRAGLLPSTRASPAHLTATRSHTGAAFSVTTASVCQRVRHWPHWES